jgi:ATP-dependent DNA ligase
MAFRCDHASSTARPLFDKNGLSVFNLIRYRQLDQVAVLCAFDLIELDAEDLRLAPIERRKQVLRKCSAGRATVLRLIRTTLRTA